MNEITEEMVNKACSAYGNWSRDFHSKEGTVYANGAMRAALTAVAPLMQAKVADGWRLVPIEPTDAMVDATLRLQGDDAFIAKAPALISALVKIYKAMLAAAPEVQS
jgi:hypothetical protein